MLYYEFVKFNTVMLSVVTQENFTVYLGLKKAMVLLSFNRTHFKTTKYCKSRLTAGSDKNDQRIFFFVLFGEETFCSFYCHRSLEQCDSAAKCFFSSPRLFSVKVTILGWLTLA